MAEDPEVIEREEIVVRKFALTDMDERWTSWLLPMCQQAYDPEGRRINARSFPGIFTSFLNSNEYNVLCTDWAIGLCELRREALEEKPKAHIIFLWVGDPENEEMKRHAKAVARRLEIWAREAGAVELSFSRNVDYRFTDLIALVNGIELRVVTRDLRKVMRPQRAP